MKKKKRFIAISITILVILFIVFIVYNFTKEKKLCYSNFVDDFTQQDIYYLMHENGISYDNLYEFFKCVNGYNKRVGQVNAYQSGFYYSSNRPVNYDDVNWYNEKYVKGEASDLNCRLTAFLLYQDLLTVDNPLKGYDNYLMFDIDAIENDDRLTILKQDKNKFVTLYEPVSVGNKTSKKNHSNKIKKEWNQRGIHFSDNENISLISVFSHDSYENKRFVGHAGVVIKNDCDQFVFLEKYGPTYPYQVSKFDTKNEMIQYILSRPDLYSGDKKNKEEEPIIMENDKVIY